jgi:hypothetical protein
MTEPKLCPTTLRWAAKHIRKFSIPRLDSDIQAVQDGAFEFAAESLDGMAVMADLAEAKPPLEARLLMYIQAIEEENDDESDPVDGSGDFRALEVWRAVAQELRELL